ncbi:MAG: ABC transporter ATP-binding protein [Hyphomicrobiales bacterium]
MTGALLELAHVSKTYGRGGLFASRRVNAVQDVSFRLEAGRAVIFTIIGESGSGKSTIARMILNITQPTSGVLTFRGRDLATIRGMAARRDFMREVQPIFQNPFEAFNPLKRLDHYLFSTARRLAGVADRSTAERLADEALHAVGLSLREVKGRFPHELSGGQLQRAAIARALLSKPSLIVADEPVSMVDASLRMSIVNVFKNLRDELKISIIYITHDLATAYYISDEVIIMRRGEVVERGPARAVLSAPQHPYSQKLKDAVLAPPAAAADAQTPDPIGMETAS